MPPRPSPVPLHSPSNERTRKSIPHLDSELSRIAPVGPGTAGLGREWRGGDVVETGLAGPETNRRSTRKRTTSTPRLKIVNSAGTILTTSSPAPPPRSPPTPITPSDSQFFKASTSKRRNPRTRAGKSATDRSKIKFLESARELVGGSAVVEDGVAGEGSVGGSGELVRGRNELEKDVVRIGTEKMVGMRADSTTRDKARSTAAPVYNFLSPSLIFPPTPLPSPHPQSPSSPPPHALPPSPHLPSLPPTKSFERVDKSSSSFPESIFRTADVSQGSSAEVGLGIGVVGAYYPPHLPLDFDHSSLLPRVDRNYIAIEANRPTSEERAGEDELEERRRPLNPYIQKQLLLPLQLSHRSHIAPPFALLPPPPPSPSRHTSHSSSPYTPHESNPTSPDLLPLPDGFSSGRRTMEGRRDQVPPTPRLVSIARFSSQESDRADLPSRFSPASPPSPRAATTPRWSSAEFDGVRSSEAKGGVRRLEEVGGSRENAALEEGIGLGFSGMYLGGDDPPPAQRESEWVEGRRVYPIIKAENIPFGLTKTELENWLPNHCLPSPFENLLSIHIILHRTTGKTLPHLYIEVATLECGKSLIRTRDGEHLGGRRVRVKWARKGELCRDLFHQSASHPNSVPPHPSSSPVTSIPYLLHPPGRQGAHARAGRGRNSVPREVEQEELGGVRREVGGGEGTGLGVVSREEMGCLINIARSDPKSFSPIERPFHHLVSLITHFPYLFPPSPHVVPSSVGKEDVESLFWTPNTRGISSPNQPPYHRPASIPPASLSSLDPFFEGSENDWNLLWETAHDLARIAGTRFLELDRSHLAKREEGSEGEKEVYWNCFLMLVRSILCSSFSPAQKSATKNLMDSFSFPLHCPIDAISPPSTSHIDLPTRTFGEDSSRMCEELLDTPPATPHDFPLPSPLPDVVISPTSSEEDRPKLRLRPKSFGHVAKDGRRSAGAAQGGRRGTNRRDEEARRERRKSI